MELSTRKSRYVYHTRAQYSEILKMIPKPYYLLMILGILCGIMRLAVADTSLTAIFYTPAMMGSWAWIQKISFLGTITQVIISICSAIGLMLMVVSIVITGLYFSNPALFDLIHEVKSSLTEGPFGLQSMFKSITTGGDGMQTVDGIIRIGLMLLPDFKRYSEVSEASLQKLGLDENVTLGQWFFRTLPRKIVVGILLVSSFSGALFQLMGDIINGGVAVINNVAQYQLKDLVNRVFAEGAQPNTRLNLGDTDKGNAQQDVANLIYSQACAANNITSTHGRQVVMNNAENFVSSHVTDSFVQGLAQGQKINETTWSSLKFNGTYVPSKPSNMAPASMYAPMSEIVGNGTQVPGGIYVVFNPHVSTTTISPFSINGKNLE